MTPAEITLRNWVNAQKSTGPKTVRGKAVVAGNAIRHGATARPNQEAVTTWLAIILDTPEITPDVLIPTDERGFRALSLAKAEVQLVAAQKALRDFEVEMPVILTQGKRLNWQDIAEGLLSGEIPPPDMTQRWREVYQHIRTRKNDYQSAKRRQRLLKRYLGEARAQRRKAFLAWLAASSGGGGMAA